MVGCDGFKIGWSLLVIGLHLPMVLLVGGNLEIGAHVRNPLCYLICLRLDEGQKQIGFFHRKDEFSFMRAQHVLSYHLI